MGDFVEARIHAPWGGDVAVSTFRIETPMGRDLCASRAEKMRLSADWVHSEGSRICDGRFNWATSEAAMDSEFAAPPRVAYLWEIRRPPEAGYAFNGVCNMAAHPSSRVRQYRIL